jgi:DNA repair exonuclease SbcCD ATPase subunit
VRVDSIAIKNFLSHVDTNLNLANLGVVLIDGENRDRGGSNGAGKTSLIEALYWCLYGQLLRDIKLSDLSYKGKGNVDVSVNLTLDDGHKVFIRRTHGNRELPPVTLQLDGVGVEAGTIAETQKKINALLKMDVKTFHHVVMFSAETASFASLTDKGQKEILDAILGLDRLPKAYTKISDKLKEFKILRQSVDNLVTTTAHTVQQASQQVKHLQASETGFQNTKQLSIKNALKNVLLIQNKKPKNDDRGDVARLATLRLRIEELAEKLGPIKLQVQETLSRLMQARQERARVEMSLQMEEEKLQLEPFDAESAIKASSACPACKQKLPKPALENLKKTYYDQATADHNARCETVTKAAKLRERLIVLDSQIATFQKAFSGHQADESEHQKLSLEAAKLDGKIRNDQLQYHSWVKELQAAQKVAEDAGKQQSPFAMLLAVEAKRLEDAQATLEKAKAEQTQRDEEQRYLDFWKQGFSNQGVKGLLLDTVTPFLNEKANEYAKILTGGTARIEFVTHYRNESDELKEKFDVSAAYNYGASTYDGVSTGERRRLDLACLFALGDLAQARSGATIQLRLLDEPFGPLDAVGQEQVLRLLNVLAERLGTVLVTSHENEIRALIDKRITVVKEYGVSRVEA